MESRLRDSYMPFYLLITQFCIIGIYFQLIGVKIIASTAFYVQSYKTPKFRLLLISLSLSLVNLEGKRSIFLAYHSWENVESFRSSGEITNTSG